MQAYASDLQNSPFINPAGPVWELHFADERAPWHASCPKLSQPWLRTVCAGHSIRIASFTRRLIRAGTHRCTAPSVVCLKGGCVRFAFPARHGGSWLILKLDHCLADGARAMCGAVRSLDTNRYQPHLRPRLPVLRPWLRQPSSGVAAAASNIGTLCLNGA
jgi:hypothetical protein